MSHFYTVNQTKEIEEQLSTDHVGILPTDTVYGLVGNAHNAKTVERIYDLKERDRDKPMIILIADYPKDLTDFMLTVSDTVDAYIQKNWPGPVSILFPCHEEKFSYLHRGTFELAIRLPDTDWFRSIIRQTGPLIGTSANKQGDPTVTSIKDAQKQFGNQVDFYVADGTRMAKPSKLIRISQDGKIETLRP